jgi:hypothetical protein
VTEISPDKDPVLDCPFDASFRLDTREDVLNIKSFILKVELYWAGKKQDSTDFNMEYLFRKRL